MICWFLTSLWSVLYIILFVSWIFVYFVFKVPVVTHELCKYFSSLNANKFFFFIFLLVALCKSVLNCTTNNDYTLLTYIIYMYYKYIIHKNTDREQGEEAYHRKCIFIAHLHDYSIGYKINSFKYRKVFFFIFFFADFIIYVKHLHTKAAANT